MPGRLGAGSAFAARFALITTALLLLLAASATAATLTVNTTGDPAGAGCTGGVCSLRQAIAVANGAGSATTISFALPVPSTISLTSGSLNVFESSSALTIDGPGANDLTVRGTGAATVFEWNNLHATDRLSGVTVSGGSAGSLTGGGIDYGGIGLTVDGVVITGNSASAEASAGGFRQDGENVTIENSTISGNTVASSAGGSNAGGIYNNGSLTLINTTVANNTVTGGGSAPDAGGIVNNVSQLNAVNSTIAGNQASSGVGGVESDGNGIGPVTNESFEFANTVIASNSGSTAPDCGTSEDGQFISQGYNLIGVGCGITAAAGDQFGTSGSPIEPKLGALGNNGGGTPTMAPVTGSPAIDKGNPATPSDATPPAPPALVPCPTSDQRGQPRPDVVGTACDIGAVETQASVPPAAQAPANTSAPSIAGTPLPGDTLTCEPGGWTGSPTNFTYEWTRDGSPIAAATRQRYQVQIVDEGHTLGCQVTATNAAGKSRPAASNTVIVAQPGTLNCPKPTGRVSGLSLGALSLGMKQKAAARILKRYRVIAGGFDVFCLFGGWGIRTGYPSKRLLASLPRGHRSKLGGKIVIELTGNPFYSLDGVSPGMQLSVAMETLHLRNPFHITNVYWYFTPAGPATGIIKVSDGLVQEVGLVNKQVSRNHRAQKFLLASWGSLPWGHEPP